MPTMVIGALGATGRRILTALADSGAEPVAGVHRPSSVTRTLHPRATNRALDLTWGAVDMDRALAGIDTVVNAAAAGGSRDAERVDRDGVITAIEAARRAGVRRWVQVSMAGVDDPSVLPGFLHEAARAKKAADDHLATSGLTWTTIRPPWLTDTPGSGHVVVDELGDGSLTREDLAAAAVAAVGEPRTFNRAFVLANGTTPIGAALSNLE